MAKKQVNPMGHLQIILNQKSGGVKRYIFTFKRAWCDHILEKRSQNRAPPELDMKVIKLSRRAWDTRKPILPLKNH